MINVSQRRALLHDIIDECDRLGQAQTEQAEHELGYPGHANADLYTDGYLDALAQIDAYCTSLDKAMWNA